MIYLSVPYVGIRRQRQPRDDLGIMLSVGVGQHLTWPLATMYWAADNQAYSPTNRPWVESDWRKFLQEAAPFRQTCLFAVAPDVVGNAEATLERSRPALPYIRSHGFKVAFASQDGARDDMIPWDEIDCLFVGGTDAWKFCEASVDLVRRAKERGLWVHVGRVNSLYRLWHCKLIGADSADGTHVKYGPDRRYPELLHWLNTVNGGVIQTLWSS